MPGILMVLIEAILQVFSCWTIAYHVVLATRLPAWLTGPLFVVLLAISAAFLLRHQAHVIRRSRMRLRTLLPLAFLSLACGMLTLSVLRPDDDDFSYFHRILVQVQHIDQPYLLTHTSDNVPGLPAISALHIMTSYEPFVGAIALCLHVDPLSAYQNGGGFVAGALVPIILALLYRQFRIHRSVVPWAVLLATLFLLIDCNTHRAFGNMAFGRLWQGKTILWSVLIPASFLVGWRFLARPTAYRFILVAMAGISAVGLSNAGVYLFPVLIVAMAGGYSVSFGSSRHRGRRAVLLAIAAFYPAAVAVAVVVHLIPAPRDMRAFTDPTEWPPNWWDNLALVIGDRKALVRDLVILLLLPLVAIARPLRRFTIALSLMLMLICANPLVAYFWMKAIQPASYWRFAYLFPVTWCVGLAAAAIVPRSNSSASRYLRAGVAATAVLATIIAYRMSLFSPGNHVQWKALTEYKLRPWDLGFVRSTAGALHGSNLLAPENVAVVATMIDPSIVLESGRRTETRYVFSNGGQEAEGNRRVAAQEFVSGLTGPRRRAAFLASARNVNAIIIVSAARPGVEHLLAQCADRWTEVAANERYVLFLRVNRS